MNNSLNSPIDWSKYKVSEGDDFSNVQDESLQPQDENKYTEPKQIDWNQYKVQETPSMIKEGVRHVSRSAARIGETIGGFPGDIVSFAESAGKWLEEKLPPPKFLKKEQNYIQKFSSDLLKKLPTSEELNKLSSELSGGFLDPQSANEEFADEIVGLASLIYGDKTKAVGKIGKVKSAGSKILKSLGKAATAKSSAKIAESYGAGDQGQLFTEMGTLVAMQLLNPKMASDYVSGKFKNARKALPDTAMVNTSDLINDLSGLEKEFNKGISTPTKESALKSVGNLKEKVSSGSYPATELVQSIHDLNEIMNSKGLFDNLDKAGKKTLKRRYGMIKDSANKEVRKLKKPYPEFYKNWSEGMEGYSAIENSKKATSFIEQHVGKLPAKVAGGIALELITGHPQMAAATMGAFASIKTGELLHRVFKSPVLRKHYLNATSAAIEENLPAFISSSGKLEDEIRKDLKNIKQ